MKETVAELALALSLIFQALLQQSLLPDDFVSPIFKKGDRSKPANYRPVSLTCLCCKLIEHIITSSVISHLKHHNILTDAQHGFHKQWSCKSQLVLTVRDLAQGIKEKSQLDVILLDFSKAFDKVAHARLLMKAAHYGVTGHTLSWIKQFLTGRHQKVVLNNECSNTTEVTSGVPQGTVLGPLLFLTFINDLLQGVTSSIRLCTDNCILYRKIESPADSVLCKMTSTPHKAGRKSGKWNFTQKSVSHCESPTNAMSFRWTTLFIVISMHWCGATQ